MSERSYKRLTKKDLKRLGEIAAIDRADLFRRKPDTGRLYAKRLFAVALCQGGAVHYLEGKNGIKDLDVWSFFRKHPERQFPPRRRAKLDFGDPKFGVSQDSPRFVGRRVDHIGRAIAGSDFSDPVAVLRQYLRQGATESARCLARKAVILIEPPELFGAVVWRAINEEYYSGPRSSRRHTPHHSRSERQRTEITARKSRRAR